MPAWVSVYSAAAPPTTTPLAGAGRARTAVTRSCAAGDRGSTSADDRQPLLPAGSGEALRLRVRRDRATRGDHRGGRRDADDALDPRQPFRVAGDGRGADPRGQHDVERGALATGELLAQHLGGDGGRVVLGQRAVVALAEGRAEGRGGQREEQPADHDDEPAPGRAWRVGRRFAHTPVSLGVQVAADHLEAVDAAPEQGEHGRQRDHGRRDREQRDRDARVGEGPQEVLREEAERGQHGGHRRRRRRSPCGRPWSRSGRRRSRHRPRRPAARGSG